MRILIAIALSLLSFYLYSQAQEPTYVNFVSEDAYRNSSDTAALKAFDGTLILVSHDRDFLDGLAEKVFEFGNKRVREHFEDINGFLRNKKIENLREIERKAVS